MVSGGKEGASGGAGAWSVSYGEPIQIKVSQAFLLNWVQNLVVGGPVPGAHRNVIKNAIKVGEQLSNNDSCLIS